MSSHTVEISHHSFFGRRNILWQEDQLPKQKKIDNVTIDAFCLDGQVCVQLERKGERGVSINPEEQCMLYLTGRGDDNIVYVMNNGVPPSENGQH